MSQSLFYWITYSYEDYFDENEISFTVLILILLDYLFLLEKDYQEQQKDLQVSILILLDYLFLYHKVYIVQALVDRCLNPYFIGLPILMILQLLQ